MPGQLKRGSRPLMHVMDSEIANNSQQWAVRASIYKNSFMVTLANFHGESAEEIITHFSLHFTRDAETGQWVETVKSTSTDNLFSFARNGVRLPMFTQICLLKEAMIAMDEAYHASMTTGGAKRGA